MRRKFLLSISLLFFVITTRSQVYNGNVSLWKQADVDAFNYTEINGDLTIGFYPVNLGENINNLTHLSMLNRVNGRFHIINNYDSLINYKGLSGLKYVRYLVAPVNYYPTDGSVMNYLGLDSINRIDTLHVRYTNTDFNGLQSLNSIGLLLLEDYNSYDTKIISFDGLNNVESINNFEILGATSNETKYKFSGFDNLRQITGKFNVKCKSNAIDFNGMNAIKYINYFYVEPIGMRPFSFNGLKSLRQIDTLFIRPIYDYDSSYNFTDLSGITSLQKLYFESFGSFCDNQSLDFMSNINMLKDFTLKSTRGFENLNGLRNVQLITGNLTIQDNQNLMNCCGIKYLLQNGGVHGAIKISNNGRYTCYSPFYTFECDNVDSILNTYCDVQRDSINLVEYKFYIDNNNNSVFDNNDFPVSNKRISLTYPNGSINTNLSDVNGRNKFYIKRGNYQFAVTSAIPNYTVSPAAVSKTFTTLSNLDSVQFIAHPTSIFNDVSIETVIGGITRVGRENNMMINIANIGTQASNGALKFKIDNRASIIAVIPPNTSSIGDTLVWNITNLLPLNNKDIYIQYKPSVNLLPGDTLYHYATFVNNTIDATPANNSFVAPDPIRGSYDPNDKSVSNQFITPAMVTNGNYLTYTIRFQNTGNDTAFRVEIRDTLSDNLDWNSIEMIGASHNYEFRQENGKYVYFTFNNIMLPDSNVNEAKSHGFISFKIKPKSTLPLGAEIKNAVDIYFDLNKAVRTNTVQTTVQLLSNTNSNPRFDGKLSVFPNPNSGAFNLKLDSRQSGNLVITITNINGQIVYTAKEYHVGNTLLNINSNNWESGTYLVNIQLNNETTSQKLLIVK